MKYFFFCDLKNARKTCTKKNLACLGLFLFGFMHFTWNQLYQCRPRTKTNIKTEITLRLLLTMAFWILHSSVLSKCWKEVGRFSNCWRSLVHHVRQSWCEYWDHGYNHYVHSEVTISCIFLYSMLSFCF